MIPPSFDFREVYAHLAPSDATTIAGYVVVVDGRVYGRTVTDRDRAEEIRTEAGGGVILTVVRPA